VVKKKKPQQATAVTKGGLLKKKFFPIGVAVSNDGEIREKEPKKKNTSKSGKSEIKRVTKTGEKKRKF